MVSLCCSTRPAAAELALEMKEHIERARAQTVLAEFPGPPVLLGGSQGVHAAHGVVEGSGGVSRGGGLYRCALGAQSLDGGIR